MATPAKPSITAVKTAAIFGNIAKEQTAELSLQILEQLEQQGVRPILREDMTRRLALDPDKARRYAGDPKESDLVIVLGGDGTLLHAARLLSPCRQPFLSVNLGSLGFNAYVGPEEVGSCLEEVISGRHQVQERMMIQGRLQRGEKVLKTFTALNDVVLTKSLRSRLIHIDLVLSGHQDASYHADGLIVASPTGSTAYNMAAEGPIVYPTLRVFTVTPICPHSITQRSLVLPAVSELMLRYVRHKDREEAELVVDGQETHPLCASDTIHISEAPQPLRLVVPRSMDYFRILKEKLYWSLSSHAK